MQVLNSEKLKVKCILQILKGVAKTSIWYICFGHKKKQTDLIPLVFYLDILGIVKYIPSRPCYITRGLNMPIEVQIRGKTKFLIRSSLTQSIINCWRVLYVGKLCESQQPAKYKCVRVMKFLCHTLCTVFRW